MGKTMLSTTEKIKQGDLTIGTWLQMPDNYTAEIMCRYDYDWLAIDMEHGLLDLGDVYRLIQVVSNRGKMPLVRLNECSPSLIRRVMDAGASGVIVPMINSAKEAHSALNALKYPPQGERSYGLGRAQTYGQSFRSYIGQINKDSILVIQIEHIRAVEKLDEILGIEGVDAIIIGPYDLTGSMGIPGEFENKRYQDVLQRIIIKAKEYKKSLGIHIVHPNCNELKGRIEQGFKFIGYGMDTIAIVQGCENAWEGVRKVTK